MLQSLREKISTRRPCSLAYEANSCRPNCFGGRLLRLALVYATSDATAKTAGANGSKEERCSSYRLSAVPRPTGSSLQQRHKKRELSAVYKQCRSSCGFPGCASASRLSTLHELPRNGFGHNERFHATAEGR